MMEKNNLFKLKAIHLLMEANGLTAEQFLELDTKYDILGYIDIAEDILHLHGDQGVLADLQDYIETRKLAERETAMHSESKEAAAIKK